MRCRCCVQELIYGHPSLPQGDDSVRRRLAEAVSRVLISKGLVDPEDIQRALEVWIVGGTLHWSLSQTFLNCTGAPRRKPKLLLTSVHIC